MNLHFIFKHVQNVFKTLKFYLTAAQQNGWVLRYVPEELETPELCLTAIQTNTEMPLRDQQIPGVRFGKATSMLEYMPKKLKTPGLCFAAVQKNGLGLQFVPRKLITPEICRAAVQNDGLALEYVPEELKTPALYMAAVTNLWPYASACARGAENTGALPRRCSR